MSDTGGRTKRPDKICRACGETICAEHYTDSIKTWASRKFCTQICRFDFHAGRNPSKIPAHSPVISPEEGACREHLIALVKSGLRSGYLYSMPANDLHRLAAELGIAA